MRVLEQKPCGVVVFNYFPLNTSADFGRNLRQVGVDFCTRFIEYKIKCALAIYLFAQKEIEVL